MFLFFVIKKGQLIFFCHFSSNFYSNFVVLSAEKGKGNIFLDEKNLKTHKKKSHKQLKLLKWSGVYRSHYHAGLLLMVVRKQTPADSRRFVLATSTKNQTSGKFSTSSDLRVSASEFVICFASGISSLHAKSTMFRALIWWFPERNKDGESH